MIKTIPETNYWYVSPSGHESYVKKWKDLLYDEEMNNAVLKCPEIIKMSKECKGEIWALDIGASIGAISYLFKIIGCNVIAFEPLEEEYKCLIHNLPTIVAMNVPVGNGELIRMDTTIPYIGGSIKTIRIDDLKLNPIDLIKIDIEGFEIFALRGMKETILKYKPILIIEVGIRGLRLNGFGIEDLYKEIPNFYKKRVLTFPDREKINIDDMPWDLICFPE